MVFQRLLAMDPGGVIPVAVALVYFGSQVPSTLLPYRFVDKLHKMRDDDDEEIKTSDNTESIFNREICESGIENENLANVLTFVCRGDDTIAKGMVTSRFSCLIGMPHYFNFESRSDVEAADLDRVLDRQISHHYRRMRRRIGKLFGGNGAEYNNNNNNNNNNNPDSSTSNSEQQPNSISNRIDWNSPAGQAYKDSLVLSPLAKRFAMARTIHETDRYYLMYGFGAAFIGTELSIFLYKRSIRDLTPSERRLYRSRYLLAAWAIGFTCWFYAVKVRNTYFERSSDEKSASYGPDIAEGGIEYYDKMLTRNIALRELLGPEGEKRFTPNGNVRSTFANWIREFNLPFLHRSFTSRRKTVVKVLEDFDEMTYDELSYHLDAQRIHRRPRKTLFAKKMATFNWKSEEAEELDRSAGVLEYDAKLLEAFSTTKSGGGGAKK